MMAPAKVTRLLAETRVMPAGTATVYDIAGDHGSYVVVLGRNIELCTCPGFTRSHGCTHLIAARLLHDALTAEGVVGVAA